MSLTQELRCICHDVPMSAILHTARERHITTFEAIAAAELAGTGCASCKPYIERMLATGRVPTCEDALRDAARETR